MEIGLIMILLVIAVDGTPSGKAWKKRSKDGKLSMEGIVPQGKLAGILSRQKLAAMNNGQPNLRGEKEGVKQQRKAARTASMTKFFQTKAQRDDARATVDSQCQEFHLSYPVELCLTQDLGCTEKYHEIFHEDYFHCNSTCYGDGYYDPEGCCDELQQLLIDYCYECYAENAHFCCHLLYGDDNCAHYDYNYDYHAENLSRNTRSK